MKLDGLSLLVLTTFGVGLLFSVIGIKPGANWPWMLFVPVFGIWILRAIVRGIGRAFGHGFNSVRKP